MADKRIIIQDNINKLTQEQWHEIIFAIDHCGGFLTQKKYYGILINYFNQITGQRMDLNCPLCRIKVRDWWKNRINEWKNKN